MKLAKLLGVVILPFLFTIKVSAQVFIKLNVQDCAKCSSLLTELNDVSDLDTAFVVVPKSYMEEAGIMKKELGLDKFNKYNYIFSDSLFQYFQDQGGLLGSKIIIKREGHIVYMAPLEDSYLDNILYNIKLDKKRAICPTPVLNKYIEGVAQSGHYVISQDRYNNVMVFDLLNNTHHEIRMDKKENLEFLYRSLYGKKFTKRFPIMKKIIEETPKLKPSIYWGYVMLKGGKIILSYLPWDFKIEGKDSSISMTSNVMIYDLKKEQFIAGFNKDTESAFAEKELMKVMKLNNKLYAHFSTRQGPVFYPIALDKKRKVFRAKDKPLQHIFPANYFQILENQGSENLLVTSDYTILMRRGDSIYSAFHDKMIRIPYPSNVLEDLTKLHNGFTYFKPSEGIFTILYKYDNPKIVYYVSFNENGERIELKGFRGFDKGSFQFINPYEVLSIDNKKHCFIRKSLVHGNVSVEE